MEFYESVLYGNVIHDIDLIVDDMKMLNEFELNIKKQILDFNFTKIK